MSNDMSGVSRSSWIAIPQAMQQHGQAKRATPSKETAGSENVAAENTVAQNTVALAPVERSEPKLP